MFCWILFASFFNCFRTSFWTLVQLSWGTWSLLLTKLCQSCDCIEKVSTQISLAICVDLIYAPRLCNLACRALFIKVKRIMQHLDRKTRVPVIVSKCSAFSIFLSWLFLMGTVCRMYEHVKARQKALRLANIKEWTCKNIFYLNQQLFNHEMDQLVL